MLELPGGVGAPAGLAVAADGSLRATWQGRLFALARAGELLWEAELGEPTSEHPRYASAPLVLADATSVVVIGRSIAFVSADGELLARLSTDELLDDSAPAPNLDLRGGLILTTQTGEVLCQRGATSKSAPQAPRLESAPQAPRLELVGEGFGYDIVPPAIDERGRLAIAGYAGKGLVLIDSAGTQLWRSQLADADLLPTIDRHGRVACGSLNASESHIYDEAGNLLARHPEAAAFAETEDGWVALSDASLVGLDAEGRSLWRREGGVRQRWGGLGPAVDRLGRIYAPQQSAAGTSLVCLEPDGRERFVLPLPDIPSDLALVGEGRAALASATGIFFVE